MSKEKLYAVKNDEGKYWDFGNSSFWRREFPDCLTTSSRKQAGLLAFANDGHVVTLIEEHEKVVLTKKQAEIVKGAHDSKWPADYITRHAFSHDDEELLMNAYVNGYTVAKEKLYNVKVPHTEDVWYYETLNGDLRTISDKKLRSEFNEAEIEHYGLQDCEKVVCADSARTIGEVTDDEQ